MSERCEKRLVQQLVAQPTIEAFDENVLLRLARRNVVPIDPGLLRPAQDRHTGEIGAVVGHAARRPAARHSHRIQLSGDPGARQRGIGNQLNPSIAAGAENIWNGNWKYRADTGAIRSIDALRR